MTCSQLVKNLIRTNRERISPVTLQLDLLKDPSIGLGIVSLNSIWVDSRVTLEGMSIRFTF
jgi:hypothetical protein